MSEMIELMETYHHPKKYVPPLFFVEIPEKWIDRKTCRPRGLGLYLNRTATLPLPQQSDDVGKGQERS